jgi:hypothetical protein
MLVRASLPFAVAATLSAQIPFDHLVVAGRTSSATSPALVIVDPDGGATTPVRIAGSAAVQAVGRTIAFDATAANQVYTLALLSTTISATVAQLTLTGNDGTRSNLNVTLGNAQAHRLRFAPGAGLVILARGTGANLFLRDMATGAITSQPTAGLLPAQASDAVVVGTKAYASSEGSSTIPSGAIVEWDFAANTDRLVGNTYPPITALASLPPLLIAGDSTGNLHLIDPQTGVASPLLTTGFGRIASIATDSTGRIFFAATGTASTASVVHWTGNLAQPLYTSAAGIDDLKACPTAAATMLTFGAGCMGSNGLVPAFTYTGMPALGATFTAGVQNALPTTGGFLLLGDSRVADGSGPLPRDLAAVGMPGCTQYGSVLATAFAPISGGTAALAIAVPNRPALAGLQVPLQWLLLDLPANALGLTTSNGAEAHLR